MANPPRADDDRPLQILQVGAFPFPAPWGSQVYTAGMVRALAARGHSVVLATYASGEGAIPYAVDVVRTPRLPGVAPFVGSEPHWTRLPHDLLLARAVGRVLQQRPIDIIHAHNVEGPLMARLARGRSGPPLVYGMHTRMEEELGDWFPGGGRAAGWLGAALDRAVVAACDASVAISDEGAAHLRALGAPRVTVLPPGVDLAELAGGDAARAAQRWDLGGRDWVLYTGNTDAYQDLDVLLGAMARLPEAGLLVVTGGDTAALSSSGIPASRLRIVSSRDFADTRDAIAAAAVAAVPRARCAGFPIKLLNTLGSGLPTVCARGSARPIAGVVEVPDRDPAAMADALGALLADPARRKALGEAARNDVARTWTWAARAAGLEGFYRQTIAAVTPPRRPS